MSIHFDVLMDGRLQAILEGPLYILNVFALGHIINLESLSNPRAASWIYGHPNVIQVYDLMSVITCRLKRRRSSLRFSMQNRINGSLLSWLVGCFFGLDHLTHSILPARTGKHDFKFLLRLLDAPRRCMGTILTTIYSTKRNCAQDASREMIMSLVTTVTQY
jgi:hypothetical protein